MSKEISKAQSLLAQALNTALASMPNNKSVIEASGHIRSAIHKLDGAAKTQMQKRKMNQTQFDNWWGNIQAGTSKLAAAKTAASPMSTEAAQKSLQQLNKMIDQQQSKIKDLEQAADQITDDELLQD